MKNPGIRLRVDVEFIEFTVRAAALNEEVETRIGGIRDVVVCGSGDSSRRNGLGNDLVPVHVDRSQLLPIADPESTIPTVQFRIV